MTLPGVMIVTVENPMDYSQAQINRACEIAWQLNRGKLLLLEPPEEDDETRR
jgi:hypothetical protein